MNRQLLTFGVSLAALFIGVKLIEQRKRKPRGVSPISSEVSDNAFAISDHLGKYLRCEDAAGNIIGDDACWGCGVWGKATDFRPAVVTGCPGMDDDEDDR